MRLIDADVLKYKNLAEVNGRLTYILTAEEIDNAPTVEERPHGKWEPIVEENGTPYWEENYEPMFLCTRCKCKSYKKPFCPHCGADMRGGQGNDPN